MIETVRDQLLSWLSQPAAFWFIYGGALFCVFLLVVGTLENLILRRPLNAFLMGGLFAAFVYFGIHWGENIAPRTAVQVWGFGVEPESEWSCPTRHPIKAVLSSSGGKRCTYYFPDAEFYNQVRPDRCYARTEEVTADGCGAPN